MGEATKADLGAEVEKLTAENAATMKEAMATAESIKDLHLDCDWLIANFQTRKEARAGEVESLKNAKAVLAGADYSLLQTMRVKRACPSTTLSSSNSENAAGTAVFGEATIPDNECVSVGTAVKTLKFCGPGELLVSRMTCDKHHEYKTHTYSHPSSAWTKGQCEDIPLAG